MTLRSVSATSYAAAGTALIAMSYGLARFAFGLYVPAIREDLGISPDIMGVVGSMAFVSFSIASLFAVAISNRLGARTTACLASLFGLCGLSVIATAGGAWSLGAGVFACGICTGLMMPALAAGMEAAVRPFMHGRVSAVMNAGTSIGIAISVPTAVLLPDRWRAAYLVFAAAALLCAVAAWRQVPTASRLYRGQGRPLPSSLDSRVCARRLSLFGLGLGLVSSAYWVFAPDLVVVAGSRNPEIAGWLWLVLGVFGLGGAVGTALASAGLFGLAYMTLTGIHLMTGVRVLSHNPPLAAVVPFLAIAVGQAVGSPASGVLVSRIGHVDAFLVMAAIGAVFALASRWFPRTRPAKDPEKPARP